MRGECISKTETPEQVNPRVGRSDRRARRLQAVQALREWRQGYPELFGTQVHMDCFIQIGMLTTHTDVIPSLSTLYGRLSCAENSVRNHLRTLASGGWVSFVRIPGRDRRSIGVRIEAPIKRAFDEYFALLDAIGAAESEDAESDVSVSVGASPVSA